MPRKAKVSDRDRFLLSRNGWWFYSRRVPKPYVDLDSRSPMIRKALGTDDLAQARAQRDILERADDEYWSSLALASEGDHAARLRQAQTIAAAMGLTYRHTSALMAAEGGASILERLRALEATSHASVAAAALLGAVDAPKVKISEAFRIYIEEISAAEIVGKSPNQIKHWRQIKEKSRDTFIEVSGDKDVDEITRDDAKAFYDHWRKRVAPAAGEPTHSANTANRELGNIRKALSSYMRHIGNDDYKNPFDGLSFVEKIKNTRPPFSTQWIKDKILAPGALAGLNEEARGIVLAMIETGCRPSELCNITADKIIIDGDVPHITIAPVIKGAQKREIKTKSSIRQIPLVGVALEVFKRHRSGFPRYRDKGDSLSAAVNSFFKENGLLPTEDHTAYSLRHSFEDRMKVGGLDTELRMILMGHSSSRPAYGAGGTLEWRRDELLKIALPFELSIFG